MRTKETVGDRYSVLMAGSTGTLGSRIAHHLLAQPAVDLRLLLRKGVMSDPVKKQAVHALQAQGAHTVSGDVTDPESLRQATDGVDIVVSALQGGPDIIVEGQVALARAAHEQGAWRLIPSDFALNLFAATPGEHPAFDLRREADQAIAEIGIEHIHVLNGAFLDGMVGMGFDHTAHTVSYWGSGDEVFEATTVEDTARFTARAALDRDLISGPFPIIGDQLSVNAMTEVVERLTAAPYTRRSNGSAEDLRAMLEEARDRGDVDAQTGAAYQLYMTTGQTRVSDPQNGRYPDITAATFEDVARRALGANSATPA
ncbi:NmrA family NAD(P)-binding protein [Mycolicibacterium hodleri]|uniref:KR domain-containing protein n=1 Tax=Mycolicibacterium hodleri TaxID=49897 RepID=A0A502EHT9_9MYCO|nr:NmrA family NAD(P)-binding protein [Mycolicibacterium hodleri]TPG37283.1 KR domain-containing protein [Mycolicibacterium hodleri]